MLINYTFDWIIWIVVIILALIIASRVASDVDTDTDESVRFVVKLINFMRNIAAFAVFIVILYTLYYVENNYTSSYIIITDNEGKVDATGYKLVGESSYKFSNGTTIELSQKSTSGATYINDSSHDILIHPVVYVNSDGSSSDKSYSDIVIPSMQTYIDSEDTISVDYIVQSISDVKKSDEAGVKFYIIPVSD